MKVFYKKVLLKISQYSQENRPATLLKLYIHRKKACNFIKKRLQHRCFPVNIVNFKNTYLEEHLQTAAFKKRTAWEWYGNLYIQRHLGSHGFSY